MLYLIGERNCLRNTLLLASRFKNLHEMSSQAILEEYKACCYETINRHTSLKVRRETIVFDEEYINGMLTVFQAESVIDDLSNEIERTPKEARVKAMSAVLAALDYVETVSPVVRRTFDRTVHTMFFHRSPDSAGGSVSSAPGVVWCAHRRDWSEEDIAEFLVHELVHNLIFIDERVHRHYIDPFVLSRDENCALSAVLGKRRPLDKAFHSAIVAYEICAFRTRSSGHSPGNIHPSTQILIDQCEASIISISDTVKGRRDIVTDRFLYLLSRAKEKLGDLRVDTEISRRYNSA